MAKKIAETTWELCPGCPKDEMCGHRRIPGLKPNEFLVSPVVRMANRFGDLPKLRFVPTTQEMIDTAEASGLGAEFFFGPEVLQR